MAASNQHARLISGDGREALLKDIDRKLLAREVAVSRRAMPSCDWAPVADAIVADRRDWETPLRKPEAAIDRSLMGGVQEFLERGVVAPLARLEPDKVAAIRAYLDPLPVYRGSHIFSADPRQVPFAEAQADSNFAGYTADQLLRAPHLVDFLNSPAIVDFIEAALGCVPTLYSVNAWWSLPATVPVGHGMQIFHRDNDDWRFFTLFLYLTDVDDDSGPHQIVAGSHTLAGTQKLLDEATGTAAFEARQSFVQDTYFDKTFSAFVERQLGHRIVNVGGPAGTAFLANTLAIHRGLMPTKKPRLVVWARFGLGPNTNSVDLEQGPLGRFQVPTLLPDTLRNRFVNRLLFEFDRGNDFTSDVPGWQAPASVQASAPPPDTPKVTLSIPPAPADIRSPEMRSIAVARRTGARRNFVQAMLNSVFKRS